MDVSELEAKEYQEELFDVTFNYDFDYDMDINPVVRSEETFYKWLDAYPFFRNVENEGVLLYAESV